MSQDPTEQATVLADLSLELDPPLTFSGEFDGEPVVGLEVAAMKSADASLGELRYRALMRATADIVWTVDLDGVPRREVEHWQEFTGQSAQGDGWVNAIHPDDRNHYIARWKAAIKRGVPFEVEQRLLRRDGEYRNMVVRGVPVRDHHNNIVEWIGTHSDITDKKTAEKKLAHSEARFRALVGATADLVSTGRVDGTELGEIEDWRAFTGLTAEDTKDLGWAAAIHPEDRAESLRRWVEAMETGLPLELEQRVRRHDGQYRIMQTCGVPVRDESGNVVEWICAHNDITDQREAEHVLRQQAELLDLAHDTIMVGDLDGTIRFWSRGAERMYGFSKEEAIGKLATPLLKSEFPQPFPEILATLERDGWWEGEVRHQASNGECVVVASRWVLQRDSTGKPVGILKTNNNITDRKRTEEVLRATESRFRKLFESDLMGIAIPDRFGGFLEGNDELLRIVGYTREDLIAGKVRWDRMTPPEYQALDMQHIAEASARGSCTPYEKEYIRKDGSRVPILCGYALLEGTEDRYIGFVQDLSPQKHVEAELREREQRFSVLAESLPQLIWVTNASGQTIYCNRVFREYTGLSVERTVGLNWNAIIHPGDLHSTVEKWKRALQSGAPYENEYRLRRHDGIYRTFLARAVSVHNQTGQVERWLGSSTDIHDQKLAEDSLRRSEKLATAGRLAASMAHEINNPLASVVNSVFLALQDVTLSEETRKRLEDADQELIRVAQFTTQTLRFHKQSVAPGSVSLDEIMDSVLLMYASRLRGSSTRVEREYGTHEKLHCFSSELRQVFANLVGNALDAVGSGGILQIRIRAARAWDSAGARGIRVTIADSGIGIPEELRPRLFEPFVSTKEATGVGLGLWVSRGIVQKHGGRIGLRSSTHPSRHGTVFSLFFPSEHRAH